MPLSETKAYDEIGAIIAYEQGELDDPGTLRLFQHLVNNGSAWSLQGSYGRMAIALLKNGLIELPDDAPASVRREVTGA